jgi:predicted AlkP superfamily phosphohydrolase/phosphomutase
MQWGPLRTVARKVYDVLGLHGRISLPQPVDWTRTKAYTSVRSTGEGISINLAGREPNGIVDPGDYERLRDEIADRLSSFTDPSTNARPVARVWRREETFKGPFADAAPDLLLEAAPLYSLSHARDVVAPADWLSGEHRIEGVFAAAGRGVQPGAFDEGPFRLVDLAPTILAGVGAGSSVAHAGSILSAVVGEPASRAAGEGRIRQGAAMAKGDSGPVGLDEREADEVEEHLRGLGYLE